MLHSKQGGVFRRGQSNLFGERCFVFCFSLILAYASNMATLQSPIDMDISDGSNSDMDVSESDQETESGPIKTMSSKQTTTYTSISPFTSTQYYPRATSDAAMLGYAPGNRFASNTQNIMTDTRTDMMNPFFVSGIFVIVFDR